MLVVARRAAVDPDLVQVATTVSPVTNIVQNIGGDRVQVTGIVPEGTNSHTFEPAPSDAAVMTDADIVFVNGLHLEEPTRELADANVQDGVPVVALGEMTISPDEYIYDFSFPEAGGDPNPHLWTNPLYALRYAEIVKDELSKVDPGGSGHVRGELHGLLEADRPARRGGPRGDGHRARGEPQAPHVPRLLPVLRARVRLGDHRRDPALRTSPTRPRRRSPA